MDLLKDKIRPLFFRYFVAATGSALLSSLFIIVDAMMIGRYHGPSGNAAISVFSPIWTTGYCLGLLSGIGGSVLYGKARGSGENENAQEYFSLTVTVGAALSVLVMLAVGFFHTPMLRFFGADDELLNLCLQYLGPVFFAIPCTVFVSILAAFLRSDRNPVLASGAVIAGGCLNIAGDYFLVFQMDMGIRGAGIATAAGLYLSILIMLAHFFRKKNTLRLVRVKWPQLPEIFRSGFPSAVNELSLGITAVIFNRQIRQYLDTDALAVFGIITGIAVVIQSIAYGIGQAAQPILSENFGAGFYSRVRACTRCGLWTSVVFGIAAALILSLAPGTLIRLYTAPTRNLLAIGPGIIRTYSFSFIFMPLNIYAVYFFQSVMKERVATAASLARGVIIGGILAFLFPLLFGAGSLFCAVPAADAAVCGYLLFSIRKESRGILADSKK